MTRADTWSQWLAEQAPQMVKGAAQGAVTGALGGPVDLMAMLMRPLGYDVEKPVMGSEWIRDRIQQTGAYQPRTSVH